MATLAAHPTEPVPLDTIPVSPAGDETVVDGVKKPEYKETDEITVFHDPDNFNVKHPLMNKWTLWFTKPPSGKVGTFTCTQISKHLLMFFPTG
jgi:translation initiation factor 4E